MNTPGYAHFRQLELKNYSGSLPQKLAEQGSKARYSTENTGRKGLPVEKITGVKQSSQIPVSKSRKPVSHSLDAVRVKSLTPKKTLTINQIESQLNSYCKELDVYLSKNKEGVEYDSDRASHFLDKSEEIYRKLSDNGFDFDTLDKFNRMDPKVKHVIRTYNAFAKRINDSLPFNGLMIYDEFLLPQKEIHSGVENIPAGHSPYNGSQLKLGYIKANRSSSFVSVENENVIPQHFKVDSHPSIIEKDSGARALSILSSSSCAKKEHAVGRDVNSNDAVAANVQKNKEYVRNFSTGIGSTREGAPSTSSDRGNISAAVLAAWERVFPSKGKSNRGKAYKLKTVTIYDIARKGKDRTGMDRKRVLERIGPELYKLKCEYDKFENKFHTFFTSRDYRLHKDAPEFVMLKEEMDALRIKLKKLKQPHLSYGEIRLQKHLLDSLRNLSDELDAVGENAIENNMLRL